MLKNWLRRIVWKVAIAALFPALVHRWKKGSEDVSSYRVRMSCAKIHEHGYRGPNYNIYWDAPMGIILQCKRSVAVIGFITKGDCVRIVQIQGVRGEMEQLKPLRWERLLVELVVAVARTCGYRHVEIQCAEKNKYYNEYNAQTFKLRYNVTARRAGFVLEPQGFHYVLLL